MIRLTLFYLLLFVLLQCKTVYPTAPILSKDYPTVRGYIKHLDKEHILVCAHRAYHIYEPENSIAAIEASIKNGIDIIEIDVRTSKDGVLLLMHDETVDRTTSGRGLVAEMSWAELKMLQLRNVNGQITDKRIPTLKEVLSASENKIIVNLDIKEASFDTVILYLIELNMIDEVLSFLGTRDKEKRLYDKTTRIITLPLINDPKDIDYYQNSQDPVIFHFTNKSNTLANNELVNKNNIKIFINALGDADKAMVKGDYQYIDSLLVHDPAVIQTDYPIHLLEYLKSTGFRN